MILAIILATLCSILGSLILRAGLYCDAFALAFCFTLAGAQYSLLKSVQPDAASPVHGFNKAAAYSRPVYLCLCSIIVLLTNKCLEDRVRLIKFYEYIHNYSTKINLLLLLLHKVTILLKY